MPPDPEEIKRRETAARAAIRKAFDAGNEEVALFISHHMEELDSDYWRKYFSTETPQPLHILESLVFKGHWGHWDGNDEMETFDFTLPGEVTDYVICARFDEDGEIYEVSMES